MEVHEGFQNLPPIPNPVVTTGSFDGVHLGHKAILKRMSLLSDQINGSSVLISFYPHPRKVIYPETAGKDLKLINTREEKIEMLRHTRLNHLILVRFTREFAGIPSEAFVKDYLAGRLQAKRIVIGFNHHFGHNREGDYRFLYKMKNRFHFDVEEIPEHDIQNECVSSTKIRKAINEGHIQRANAYLDHYYFMLARHKLVRQYPANGPVFYTLNMNDEEKLFPPPGAYAVSTLNGTCSCKGIAYIQEAINANPLIKVTYLQHPPIQENRSLKMEFRKCLWLGKPDHILNRQQFSRDKAMIEQLIY